MKKMVLAVAVVLAALLSSCGDTEHCYEVTLKVDSIVSVETTTYYWGTKNDLDSYKQSLKDAQTKLGVDEKTITIKSVISTKSKDDCHE